MVQIQPPQMEWEAHERLATLISEAFSSGETTPRTQRAVVDALPHCAYVRCALSQAYGDPNLFVTSHDIADTSYAFACADHMPGTYSVKNASAPLIAAPDADMNTMHASDGAVGGSVQLCPLSCAACVYRAMRRRRCAPATWWRQGFCTCHCTVCPASAA